MSSMNFQKATTLMLLLAAACVSRAVPVKLQVLMPGEIGVPNTPSGKTGTATALTAGTPFSITVNIVDINWSVVNTNDTVSLSSSDPAAILPANAALAQGTATFTV